MCVRRDLLNRDRDLLRASRLGELEGAAAPRALMDRHAAAQVGYAERRLTVAAVGRPDQLEQRLVLGDREQLALAEHPPRRREVPAEHPNLTDVWLGHESVSSVPAREDALQRDAEAQRQEGLLVEVRLAAPGVRDRPGVHGGQVR